MSNMEVKDKNTYLPGPRNTHSTRVILRLDVGYMIAMVMVTFKIRNSSLPPQSHPAAQDVF